MRTRCSQCMHEIDGSGGPSRGVQVTAIVGVGGSQALGRAAPQQERLAAPVWRSGLARRQVEQRPAGVSAAQNLVERVPFALATFVWLVRPRSSRAQTPGPLGV